jgi:hypothetical protein
MAIAQGATNTFKIGLLDGAYDFGTTTFKIALFNGSASIGPDTTAYTSGMTGEVVATGYTAGGQTLTVSQVPTVGNQTGNATAYLSFSNVTWTAALTARGALIYKFGSGNPTVCVLDFGADKTSTTTFTVQFPAVTSTAAIIRIS